MSSLPLSGSPDWKLQPTLGVARPNDDLLLGEYLADANIVMVNATGADFVAALRHAATLPMLDPLQQFAGTHHTRALKLGSLAPWITFEHEHAHYRNLMSSPFGLLVWRCYQALTIDVGYLKKLSGLGLFSEDTSLPAVARGAEAFVGQVPHARALVDWLMTDPEPRSEHYAEFVCFEQITLIRYLRALLDGRGVTCGQMYELAGIADFLLSVRSEAPIGRTFRRPSDPDLHLVQDGELTPMEILEAVATVVEENALGRRSADRATHEKWQFDAVHGVYEKGYRYFRKNFGYIAGFEMAAALAFSGPVDIACRGEGLDLPGAYPSRRLQRLAEYCSVRVNSASPRRVDDIFPTNLFEDDYIETYRGLSSDPLWGDGFLMFKVTTLSAPADLVPGLEKAFVLFKSCKMEFHDWQRSTFHWHFSGRASGDARHFAKVNDRQEYAPLVLLNDAVRWNLARSDAEDREAERQVKLRIGLWMFAIDHADAKRSLFGTEIPSALVGALEPTGGLGGLGRVGSPCTTCVGLRAIVRQAVLKPARRQGGRQASGSSSTEGSARAWVPQSSGHAGQHSHWIRPMVPKPLAPRAVEWLAHLPHWTRRRCCDRRRRCLDQTGARFDRMLG